VRKRQNRLEQNGHAADQHLDENHIGDQQQPSDRGGKSSERNCIEESAGARQVICGEHWRALFRGRLNRIFV
jgi:hypothetical protein